MTRLSQLLLPTERQPPADAEAISHKLMVRAGLIRQVGAGLWSWLPAGWRVHQKAVQIIREEMDAIGGQEMLMPVLHPAEPWKRTGRYDIDEIFKLQDRRGAEMVLAMTHEEIVTLHVAQVVRSYRDLPKMLYHFQIKERDEPRPRAGVLRTREFIMKDAYTFDRDEEGLAAAYDLQYGAYTGSSSAPGSSFYAVESDVGMMGGSGAHEFMAPCAAGENDVALAPGYAANVEVASAEAQPVPPHALEGELHTPGMTTIDAVAGSLGVAGRQPAQGVSGGHGVARAGHGLRARRPPHQRHQAAQRARRGLPPRRGGGAGRPRPGPGLPRARRPTCRRSTTSAIGTGPLRDGRQPHRLPRRRPGAAGRARRHAHGRAPGDLVGGQADHASSPRSRSATSSSSARATPSRSGRRYLDESGKEKPVVMGSYGIGPARIAAAAVEQSADEQGISWPRALAPWDVEVVALGKPGRRERQAAEELYAELRTLGLDVLLDDRDGEPGGEVRRRRAARLPAAADRRQADASSRRRSRRRRAAGARTSTRCRSRAPAEAVRELWRALP